MALQGKAIKQALFDGNIQLYFPIDFWPNESKSINTLIILFGTHMGRADLYCIQFWLL